MNTDYYHGKLNMLGIDEYKTIFDATFVDTLLHVTGDVDKSATGGDFEPEFFAVAFHLLLPSFKMTNPEK
jgi:hypothetical protein